MEDLTGRVFNRLTVLSFDRKSSSGKYFWKCQCSCGNIKSQRSDSMKSGKKKSCGCINSPGEKYYKENIEKRLLSKSERVGECLLWTGRKIWSGYGTIGIRSHSTAVHRVAYKMWNGDIPKGMYVLHKCDIRHCIEPSHLYLGTHHDNMKDMVERDRQYHPLGELHKMSKFKDENILEIRALYASGKYSQADLSRKYEVCGPCIHNIVKRKSWKHLP